MLARLGGSEYSIAGGESRPSSSASGMLANGLEKDWMLSRSPNSSLSRSPSRSTRWFKFLRFSVAAASTAFLSALMSSKLFLLALGAGLGGNGTACGGGVSGTGVATFIWGGEGGRDGCRGGDDIEAEL
jgi:hypothetical protein